MGLDWRSEGSKDSARLVAFAGKLEVGTVLYDPSNRFWVWSSTLSDEAWGYGPSEDAAKRGYEAWLRAWLENFRGVLDGA
jgi:hypothetical protein